MIDKIIVIMDGVTHVSVPDEVDTVCENDCSLFFECDNNLSVCPLYILKEMSHFEI